MRLRRPVVPVLCLAAGLVLSVTEGPAARTASQWIPPSDEAIRALLASRVRDNGVGTVVAVVHDDRRSVIAYGRSGAPDERPLDGETVFQLGSLTKVLTGLLLADMVTRGEVGLDDPVRALLPPDVRLQVVGRPITLRDLSTHTSGLPSMPDNFDIRGMPDPYEAYTVEQLWGFLTRYTPPRAPGTKYEYSNLGVSLLGRALALRQGATYEAVITERVLAPLGMTSTSITLQEDQQRRLAPGHDPYRHPIDEWEMATLQASGSLRSTASDMSKLLALYLDREGRSGLHDAAILQMREGVALDTGFVPLGLGRRADGTFAHAGGKQGYRTGLAFNPATGIGVVVLSNIRTYDSEPMTLAMHLATGAALPPASPAPADKPRLRLSSDALSAFAGRYRSEAGTFEVVAVGERLRIRYPNNSIFQFVASGPRDFFYDAGNDDITFEVGASGKVTEMTIYGDGKSAGVSQVAYRIERNPREAAAVVRAR